MKVTALIVVFFAALVPTIGMAQNTDKEVCVAELFKIDHTIQSKAFGDERKITVYLPPHYYAQPDDKFTVTYVLDGHFDPLIDLGVKTLEYNSYMYKITPTIVVGVHAKERGWEFSAPDPDDPDDGDYKGGRAPELQRHFKEEIFPLIDSVYSRTLPFRSLVGHSSGGSFVLLTLFSDQKDLFDSYIGISPALRPGEQTIVEDAASRLRAGETFNKFLYCSHGTVGEREALFGAAMTRLDSVLKVYPDHGLMWRKSCLQGMDHFTLVGPSFNESMVELTRAFRVDEQTIHAFADNKDKSMTEQLDGFYAELAKKHDFKEIPRPGYVSRIAWYVAEKGHPEAAIEIYDWALKHHPGNYTLRKQKGKRFVRMGQMQAAHAAFTDAVEILKGLREIIGGEAYQEQLAYMKEKLKETSE